MLRSNVLKSMLLALVIVGFSGCSDSDDANDSQSTHQKQVTNILFAHGFLSDAETWDHYSEVTANYNSREWIIYRTNVSKTGTIAVRASQLADYINAQNVEENSMLVVGHSMGGLDLRYIISEGNKDQTDTNKYYTAAKKIHQFYTIATPHKGSDAAGLVPVDDGAVYDLSSEHMTEFNEENPYSNSNIDGRAIEMLAFRFACNKQNDHDGVVATDSQILDGAPYTKEIIDGKHTTGEHRVICEDGIIGELDQDPIINSILNNNTPEQIANPL
ncbi:lipase/acyltransferase domain-containing protein [Sulfurovum sp.]|uniref:esterase/lipase family protein n=1 Tax=Sulfurovum sp. TaxID=1969726 RepID=UPI0028680DC5|nr:hypothetical protein [Sulfurovum sp.]